MTAEELYQKEFGSADSIPKESVIRLLKHLSKALKIEREQALHIQDVSGRIEQCDHEWLNHSFDHFGFLQEQICDKCGAKQSVP